MNPAGFSAALAESGVRLVPRRPRQQHVIVPVTQNATLLLSDPEAIRPLWIASSWGWTATLDNKKFFLVEPEVQG